MTVRKGPVPQQATRDELRALLGLVTGLPGTWRSSSCTIAMEPVLVSAAGVEWRVHLHAYGTRLLLTDARKVELVAGLTISAIDVRPAQARRFGVKRWQQSVAKRLNALGYKGFWGSSPDGPFAHFSKQLRRVSSVPAAIRQLQRVRF
jgi:hypothetical protein